MEGFLGSFQENLCIQLPYPVHKPYGVGADAIEEFLVGKDRHNRQFPALVKDFKSLKDDIQGQNFQGSHVQISNGILEYCKGQIEDCHLQIDYNPFYATGILEHFNLNGADYLIRPDGDTLRITNVSNPGKRRKLKLDISITNLTGVTIASEHSDPVVLVLQHRNEVNLLKLNNLKAAELEWSKKFKKRIMSSRSNLQHLAVVLSNLTYKLYNIHTDTKLDVDYNDPVTSIEFCKNDIAFLNDKALKLYDVRSKDWREFKPNLDPCNILTCLKLDEHFIYMGTRHHLLKADDRFLKNAEYCSHLMKSTPCYLEFLNDRMSDTKYVCLSSQSPSEKVLFYGPAITGLPLNIPSLKATLRECGLRRDILLKGDLEGRLLRSTAGIKLINVGNEIYLYTTNVHGEISKQTLSKSHIAPKESIDALAEWVGQLPQAPPMLHLTNVVNLSHARFLLNKPCPEQGAKKSHNRKLSAFYKYFNVLYGKEQLGELAGNFSTIWDDEDDEDGNFAPEVAPNDKVTKWIESSDFF